ncbi:hypothetical protein VTN31DRAFT_5303 [Thermomyces dupontii]|uniref:uncharacterized protein n=1 Tax=Talaromyces thermophilus TaxID=28565 RepID=UPI0037432604
MRKRVLSEPVLGLDHPAKTRMRRRRLVGLLLSIALAGFTLFLLRDAIQTVPLKHNASPIEKPDIRTFPIDDKPEMELKVEGSHPISRLILDAGKQFKQRVSSQSKSLPEAVAEYRRRYGMPPPPNFDKWYKFARDRGVQIIDDYDTIYHSLLPFWSLPPKVIRQRAKETIGFDNNMIALLVRNGKIANAEGGGDGYKWQREATVEMMKPFVQYLPDMDLAFNTHDEPRVVIPTEDLQRLVSYAKEVAIPATNKKESLRNSFSRRPSDLGKGDQIEEVTTTRFNRFAHQATWTHSRMSCPVGSPARSLDENAQDDTSRYAMGDLGFIYNTTAFSDICLTPSLRHTHGFFDRPNAFDIVQDLFPVFSQSKISSFQDILYPSPWYWAGRVAYNKSEDRPWDKKSGQLYWRGSTTGGYSRDGGWRRQHRQNFVDKVDNAHDDDKTKILTRVGDRDWAVKNVPRKSYQDLFNVKFTFIGQCDVDDCAAQEKFFDVAEKADPNWAWQYKYLADIDGNAFSGRYYSFLLSNSLVFKIALFREWHDEWLKPWVHYVPLSFRGDEYVESVRYFTEEEDGRIQGPLLAKQSKEWAQKVLRKEDMEAWFFRLLLEYGRLIDDNRETIGFSL